MKPNLASFNRRRLPAAWFVASLFAVAPAHAHASIFKGETLDRVADVLTWVVLVIAPIVGIAVFLLIHILPEKIAEKKEHPQTKAIQCLCLLSLVFGGMLFHVLNVALRTAPRHLHVASFPFAAAFVCVPLVALLVMGIWLPPQLREAFSAVAAVLRVAP